MYKRLLIQITVILSYTSSFIVYRLDKGTFYYNHFWNTQFNILMGFLLLLSLILIFSKKANWLILILKFFLLILLTLPLSNCMEIKYLLFPVFFLEFTILNRPVTSIIWGLLFLLIIVILQKPFLAWDLTDFPGPYPAQKIVLAFLIFLVSIVCLYLKNNTEKQEYYKRVNRELNQTVSRLMIANVGYQNYAFDIQENTERKERIRISREIHDTVGYGLTNIIMLIQAAIDLWDLRKGGFREQLMFARDQAQDSLFETRMSLRELRNMTLAAISSHQSIIKLITEFSEATKVKTIIHFGNVKGSYGIEIDKFVYRMIQEGIINAFRHGKANVIEIFLWQISNILRISIRDNGGGANNINEGIGLAGMKERALQLNGIIIAGNIWDGFMVTAEIPSMEEI